MIRLWTIRTLPRSIPEIEPVTAARAMLFSAEQSVHDRIHELLLARGGRVRI